MVLHPPQTCNNNSDCDHGYGCVNNTCVLEEQGSPLQVTLYWNEIADLDLHLVEPSGCETFWDNNTCTTVLDGFAGDNSGCSPVYPYAGETIYVPTGSQPASGTYGVRVDYYSNCNGTGNQPFPYEVVVRQGSTSTTYCGTFDATAYDFGDFDAGARVTTFTVP